MGAHWFSGLPLPALAVKTPEMNQVLVTSAFATTQMQKSLFAKHHCGKWSITGVEGPESSYQTASSKPYYTKSHLLVSMLDSMDCHGQRAQPSLLETCLSCQEGISLGRSDGEPQISPDFISGKPASLETSVSLPSCSFLKTGQARLVLSLSLILHIYGVPAMC